MRAARVLLLLLSLACVLINGEALARIAHFFSFDEKEDMTQVQINNTRMFAD